MTFFFFTFSSFSNRRRLALILSVLTILLIQAPTTYSILREYNISITYAPIENLTPERLVIQGNGQHPLPTIVVNPGDEIKLTMTNNIQSNTTATTRRRRSIDGRRKRNKRGFANGRGGEMRKRAPVGDDLIDAFALHFHGILQNGADYNTTQIYNPLSDGVPFITQLPTKPGESFVYHFTIANDNFGTYFYHSHWLISTLSGHGAFIVKEATPPAEYGVFEDHPYNATDDEPFVILLSELWTESDEVLAKELTNVQDFTFSGPPSYLLINGNVLGDTVFLVEASKTYRIRLISGNVLEDMAFGIFGHKLTIIEVDGSYVKPVTVDYLDIAPGQRYSVLLTADQTPGDYNIAGEIRLRDEVPKSGKNATAILRYANSNTPPTSKPMLPDVLPDLKFEMLTTDKLPPAKSDRTITVVAQVHEIPTNGGGLIRWNVNGVIFEDFQTPLLVDLLNGTRSRTIDWTAVNSTGIDTTRGTYPLKKNEVIDMVFQNSVGPSGTCDFHPWHLHGHGFWELTSGPGKYPEGLNQTDILANPVIRDTASVFANPTAKGTPDKECGWKLVRFVASNPGVWAVHCHIIPHMVTGLMFVMEEAVEEIPLIPQT